MNETIKNFKCFICDTVGEWENVDEYTLKNQGMHICKKCGFVAYPEIASKEDELIEYYRKDYRNPPTAGNFFTGQKKCHYHGHFLNDLFESWIRAGKEKPVIGEIGAAYGLFLKYIKDAYFPHADVSGTEITLAYRRNAKEEFDINLSEELNTSKKYDLLCSYKVLEHQAKAYDELVKYRANLKEDGLLYISVPIWFGTLTNFGANGFDLGYYYHKNHINVWSEKHFEYLLIKAGFEIIKKDDVIYDNTYLCRPNKNIGYPSAPCLYEEIKEKLFRIFEAGKLFKEMKFAEAIAIYPNFPQAQVSFYERNRANYDKEGYDWIKANFLTQAAKDCPTSADIVILAADLAMRYAKYEEAIILFEKVLDMRPNFPMAFMQMGQCLLRMADKENDESLRYALVKQARDIFRKVIETSEQMKFDALTWVYRCNSLLPMPNE